MKNASPKRREGKTAPKYMKRYLLLRRNGGEEIAIRCTEETINNYYGWRTGDALHKVQRWDKMRWQAIMDSVQDPDWLSSQIFN